MLSEKLLRILKAKSPFTDAQLASMTEAEGWRWVYGQPKRAENRHLVCFTGFPADEKAELVAHASSAGIEVVGSVTKRMTVLVTGAAPGPSKLEKGASSGCAGPRPRRVRAHAHDGRATERARGRRLILGPWSAP